jgi:hypothetical protein
LATGMRAGHSASGQWNHAEASGRWNDAEAVATVSGPGPASR